MAKITISVPDDLYKKMQEWKSTLNFSKVFQNAMYEIIQKKEALKSKIREDVDLESVVNRLKKEKNEHELNITEWGKKDGLEWCKTAHYRELQYALAWKSYENPHLDEELGDYFSHMLEKHMSCLMTTGKKAQYQLSDFSERYLKGWKEGVELFWNEVKDKI